MKLSREFLRRLIVEESLKPEPEGEGQQEPMGLSADSLDDQVDALFIKYENQAIGTVSEGPTLRSAMSHIFEQEGGEEEAGEVAAGDSEIVGSEEMTAEQPTEERQPPLNIDNFAGSVARLIMNYDSLLDPLTVIINRAMNFLANRYDKSVVDDFTEIMAQQYGMELNPVSDEQPPPAAAGAGPSPAGA
jgi:hypothetical protein